MQAAPFAAGVASVGFGPTKRKEKQNIMGNHVVREEDGRPDPYSGI
jgi:hypothetical protein